MRSSLPSSGFGEQNGQGQQGNRKAAGHAMQQGNTNAWYDWSKHGNGRFPPILYLFSLPTGSGEGRTSALFGPKWRLPDPLFTSCARASLDTINLASYVSGDRQDRAIPAGRSGRVRMGTALACALKHGPMSLCCVHSPANCATHTGSPSHSRRAASTGIARRRNGCRTLASTSAHSATTRPLFHREGSTS